MSDHEKSLNVVSDTRELRDSAVTSRDPYIVVALEALLHTAVSMPVRNGPQAVVTHLLDSLQQLLPGAAVGAHVVDPHEPETRSWSCGSPKASASRNETRLACFLAWITRRR
jgi:hypothetical protein